MQDPDKPRDDGKVRLPRTDPGMNKIAPTSLNEKKGDTSSDKIRFLRKEYKDKEEDDSEILSRARKRLEMCISAESDNRRDGLDDDKFYAGDQWPADVRARRNSEKRPCLTINKLPVLVKQITNDQRQNRPTIDIHPAGDRGDIDVAKIYRGLIREIERKSHADQAYDTGFESAARKGWGYWRVIPEFEDFDTFDQVLRVKRIRNAYSVYKDPNSTEIDASDMKFCFITEMIDRDEFKVEWPNADPMPWTVAGYGDNFRNWVNEHSIRIAEYYETKVVPRELVLLNNGFEGWRDELGAEALERYEIVDTRRSLVPEIWWYKITAKDILERTRWLGQWIPVIQCIGDEIDIEGRVRLWGLVRHAKDPQRTVNYFRTSEVERVALSPKAPFIIAEGQLEGYEGVWKEANTKSFPFLPYRAAEIHGHMVPPPVRQPPVDVPRGDVNIAASAAQDMLTPTGVRFDATLNERTYDESGRALRELRRSGDIGSFNLVDNLIHSLRHTGEILVDAIPQYYTRPGRVLTILREDDTEEQVRLNPNSQSPVSEAPDPNTQRVMRAFDPTYGRYGVTVTIGPSYATRRIETAESMMDFLRAIPTAAPLIADLVAKNQDWEGAEEIATRLAKTLPPGLNTPELRDIPPQLQAVLSQMQQQIGQLTQERNTLMAQLNDRNQDRQLARDRINRQFEVQLLNIVQKAHAAAQKLGAEDRRTEAETLRTLASESLDLYGTLLKGAQDQDKRHSESSASSATGARTRSAATSQSVEAPPIPGARLSFDGNFYIPDPNRPGKYLMIRKKTIPNA
jgi:hypothetical protein